MKGFVLVFGTEIVLRFLHHGAFKSLEARHDLIYVVLRSGEHMTERGLDGQLAAAGREIAWIPFYTERERRWHELFDLSCIMYQDRSPSFAVRSQEQSWENPSRFARLKRLVTPGPYAQYRAKLERQMGFHPELLKLTLREQPDFFVLPSKLLDYLTDDALQVAEQFQIPTLLLVSGWDSLSSKGLLYDRVQPRMVGCWGEQSRRHAMSVQGLAADRVSVVGAPHYEWFRSRGPVDRPARRRALNLPEEGQVVLFAGAIRPFDETQLLRDLEAAISSGALPAMHVLYRPHPWRCARQQEQSFYDYTWRHITIDPQVAESYRGTKERRQRLIPDNFVFDLAHLNQVYEAVDAVMSPMSTVLLEALLSGLPTMAVAFGDGKHSWSPDKVSTMLHFKEMYEIPELVICRDRTACLEDVRRLVAQIGDEALRTALRERARYFVHQDERSYADRVGDVLERMLAPVEARPTYDGVVVKPGKGFRLQAAWRQSPVPRVWRRMANAFRAKAAR